MEDKRRLLVIGGRGALGQEIVKHFKDKNVWVASVDQGANDGADLSIVIDASSLTTAEQAASIEVKLTAALNGTTGVLHGIICVAGGWAGGNILSDDFLSSLDLMGKQSVESSAVAAYLAGKFLKAGGILVMTGAQAALEPTPTMISYGMAKSSVHHLVKSLAAEGSGLPKNCVVVGLLPRTLDTPNNRKFSTGSVDYSTWTPLGHVSGLMQDWFDTPKGVRNGALVEVITKGGKTTTTVH